MDAPRQKTLLSRKDRDAKKLAAELRSVAGGDETKGDATGVSMTGGGALTTAGATVGGGTTAGGTTGVTGSATGFTGATTGATAAGAGTPAAPPKQVKPKDWMDTELTKTAAKNDAPTVGGGTTGGKTRTEDKRADADADAGGKTVTRTDADYCKGATTVGGDATGAGAGKPPASGAPDSDEDFENWSLCGLEDDNDDDFTDEEGPQRIKESRLTPEERTRFQGILDQIFARDVAVNGRKIPFPYEDVYDVMCGVHLYFESEPVLIEDLPFDIVVVADIHGQLYDLNRIFTSYAQDGKPGWECRKFLFLGDYVDRGRQQLEVIMGLFCIKMLFPDNIFLLRGNHEFVPINLTYGFARELNDRYDKVSAKRMYFGINRIFCYMSIGAIIGGNAYFCAHAGVSPVGFTRSNLRAIYKPIYYSYKDPLIHDMTWADPAEGLRGTCVNGERHSSHFLGIDSIIMSLKSIGCMALLRGHTILEKGYQNQSHVVMALFSATGCLNNNDAAVGDIDATGRFSVKVFPCSPEREKFEALIYKSEGKAVEDDAKTVADDGTGALAKM